MEMVGKINIDKLLKFHKSHNKIATLTSVKPPSRFGEIVTKENKVQFFQKTPSKCWKNKWWLFCL